jgi:hypothetical protein
MTWLDGRGERRLNVIRHGSLAHETVVRTPVPSPKPSDPRSPAHDGGAVYLTSGQVLTRYGNRSPMWIWRRERDADFPKPALVVATRKYWSLSSLVEWEQSKSPLLGGAVT